MSVHRLRPLKYRSHLRLVPPPREPSLLERLQGISNDAAAYADDAMGSGFEQDFNALFRLAEAAIAAWKAGLR